MAILDIKKKRASNMPSKMAVKVEMFMVAIYKVATILVVLKSAVYFKLFYFNPMYLQANMLSSFIFT